MENIIVNQESLEPGEWIPRPLFIVGIKKNLQENLVQTRNGGGRGIH